GAARASSPALPGSPRVAPPGPPFPPPARAAPRSPLPARPSLPLSPRPVPLPRVVPGLVAAPTCLPVPAPAPSLACPRAALPQLGCLLPPQTIDQFEYDGCDNCDAYLQMKGNREMVYDCTSSSFDGIIAMMSPEDSWVSKWQRISNFKPGVYAVSVTGRLPQGIVRELKSRGVAYKSRDTAIKT
uniref:SPT4 homolog, DSIF elongation factor subunit n=18 Tax=Aves TaxID=8782 RepID=A0A8C4JG72_DRONO